MSKNRNRGKLNKSNNNHEYKILWLKEEFPMYWDEGVNFYPKNKKGFKNSNKQIMSYQVRMYKTWKHNRQTQWK